MWCWIEGAIYTMAKAVLGSTPGGCGLLHVPLPSEPDTAVCTSAIWTRHCMYLCHLNQTLLRVPLPSEPDTACTSAIWTRHCMYLCHLNQTLLHVPLPSEPDTACTCHLNQTLPHLPLPSEPDTATFTSAIWTRHCCILPLPSEPDTATFTSVIWSRHHCTHLCHVNQLESQVWPYYRS